MKPGLPEVDRRTLLIGGGIGVGLVVAVAAWRRRLQSALTASQGEQTFGHYVKIASDGRITVAVPQTETGQGIWTALPQIVADELGADWEMVGVEPAPAADVYANRLATELGWTAGLGVFRRWRLPAERLRMTAGSTSVRAFYQPMRHAGAVARAMLIEAAAERWDVDPLECDAVDSMIHHAGKTFRFGELAEEAASRAAPNDLALRSGRLNRLVGQPLPRLDLLAKSNGSFRFAADVRLPEMLFASARLAPPKGRLTGFSRAGAMRVPGVRGIVVRRGWIAAVAETWWAAERALQAAGVRFEGRESIAAEDMRTRHETALESAESRFSSGDYDTAVESSRPLAASYWVEPAQQFALEPISATARFSGDGLEVWAASQAPGFARAAAEDAAPDVAVTFYPMAAGEPGGQSLENAAIPLAIAAAREMGRPVQLILPPDSTQNQGRAAPAVFARMTALPGQGGLTTAWKMRIASSNGLGSAIGRLARAEASPELDVTAMSGAIPPYAIPNVRVDAAPVPETVAGGYMRGHPERAHIFFIEGFIDELARAAGLEPFVFRMGLLGSNPRLAACLQRATAAAGWDGGARGSSMGLAAASIFGSHIALVATASVGADQRIEVSRLTAAVDCGRIVNPGIVRQQIEGGLIAAMGLASVRAPQWAAGMPRSRPLGAAGLPGMKGTPQIDVHMVPSSADPGGVSGLGIAILAPAVANAIFAGTGRRLRSLPFDLMSAG